MHYGENREAAEAVVAQIRGDGGQADAIRVDLAVADGAHRLADAGLFLASNQSRWATVEIIDTSGGAGL